MVGGVVRSWPLGNKVLRAFKQGSQHGCIVNADRKMLSISLHYFAPVAVGTVTQNLFLFVPCWFRESPFFG
eukprot:4701478-Amphidinium_carterae.1